MNSKPIIIVSMLLLFSLSSEAQKLKYKDIYPKLAAKNYKDGIPELKMYLSMEENRSEANPNLQMGLWLYERFIKTNDTAKQKQVGDSALVFLKKALNLIDEKEVKKRDEYYEEFVRRDLRSGKFGIKVSDVHLAIETKVEEVENKLKAGGN